MASKATRKALLALGIAHGVTDSIEASYREAGRQSKTVDQMLERIRYTCQRGFNLWPERLNQKELNRISKEMDVLEGTIIGSETTFPVLTSTALALLSDLRGKANKDKRDVLDRLLSLYWQMHKYFDRRLDKWGAYDTAKNAVNRLSTEMG